MKELKAQGCEDAIPLDVLSASASNILMKLLFSRRFGHDHPKRAYINDFISVVLVLSTQVLAINFFPWLRSALSYLGIGACGRLRKALQRRNQFSEWAVNENKNSYVDGVIRNFTDGFLDEMKRGGEERKTFTQKLLVGNVASYIGGGTATTYTALQWLLLMSAAYPQLQSRVRAETDAIMKERESVSTIMWNDRRQMPYTNAFIWETIRCNPVNPLSIMRW
ncbi:hypothetical protein MTO96_038062 [Rhipicephalus appendiculatus]